MSSKRPSAHSAPFRMRERDYDILRDVARCGGLTAEQINYLHFPPAVAGIEAAKDEAKEKEVSVDLSKLTVAVHSNCERRLKLLWEGGFLTRIERYQLLSEGKKPYLYALTTRGAECLAEYLGCTIDDLGWRKRDVRLRPNYIEHLIMTNDIRIAVMKGVQSFPAMVLQEWRDEITLAKLHGTFKIPLLRSDDTTEMVSLIPDAYFVLQTPAGELKHFFLEVDRGTETASASHEHERSFKKKIETFIEFLEGGLYEEKYGTHTGRVLTVTTGPKRLARLKQVSEEAGAQQRFWFTLHKTVMCPSVVALAIPEDAPKRMKQATACYPNIISDKLWTYAHNDTGILHSLDEYF